MSAHPVQAYVSLANRIPFSLGAKVTLPQSLSPSDIFQLRACGFTKPILSFVKCLHDIALAVSIIGYGKEGNSFWWDSQGEFGRLETPFLPDFPLSN